MTRLLIDIIKRTPAVVGKGGAAVLVTTLGYNAPLSTQIVT